MEELDDEHRKQLIVDIVQIVSKQVPIATDTDQIERQLCRSSTTLMNLPLLLEIETTHPPSSRAIMRAPDCLRYTLDLDGIVERFPQP